MKAAHLEKIGKRAERVLNLLLPWEVSRGEVADPKARLAEIIKRVDSPDRNAQLKNDVWALTELLETDVPEMIKAVLEAQAEARQAREELSQRAGTTYRITLTSDTPIGVITESADMPDDDGCEARQDRRDERETREEQEGNGS